MIFAGCTCLWLLVYSNFTLRSVLSLYLRKKNKIGFFGQILLVDLKVLWVFQILMIGGQLFPTVIILFGKMKFFNDVYNLLCRRLFGRFESGFVFDDPRSVVSVHFFFVRTCCLCEQVWVFSDSFDSASGVYTRCIVNESRLFLRLFSLFFGTKSRRFLTLKHSFKCLVDCKLVCYCNIEYV